MPRILVISSCTARKGPMPARADALYEGEHHRRLMRGIRALRSDPRWRIDLRIVSAKHGLLTGDRYISPYDESFAGVGRRLVRARADALGIPGDVESALRGPSDLTVVALGDDYLTAAGLEAGITAPTAPTLLLCAPGVGRRMRTDQRVLRVELGVPEARRFSCGFIGLKGEVTGRLLLSLAQQSTPLIPRWRTSKSLLDHLADDSLQLPLAA